MPVLIPTSAGPDMRKRIVLIFRALTWFVVTEIEICTDSSFCSVDGTLGRGITGMGTISFFSKPKKKKKKITFKIARMKMSFSNFRQHQ